MYVVQIRQTWQQRKYKATSSWEKWYLIVLPNCRYWLVMMESWHLYLKLMMHKVWIPSCYRMDVLERTHPWDYLCIHSTFLLNGCILTTRTPHAPCDQAPCLVGMPQDEEQHMVFPNQLLYALDSLPGSW